MNKYLLSTLFYFYILFCFSQEYVIDSLLKKSYKELSVSYRITGFDSIKALFYAKAYLEKGKLDKDTIRIADGYYFLSGLYSDKKMSQYCDSIITLTSSFNIKEAYPTRAYRQKGVYYHDIGDFNTALKFYLKAINTSNINTLDNATAKFNIATLKYRLGLIDDAKNLFKEYVVFVKNNKFPNKNYYLNRSLYSFSDALIFSNKLDSAMIIIKEGINECLKSRDVSIYNRFVLNSGICLFYEANYHRSIDSLLKSKKLIKNQKDDHDLTLAINNSYLSKNYFKIGEEEKALQFFKEVSFFLNRTKDVSKEVLDLFPFIIDYYKLKKNKEKQLLYIEELMRFDSIHNTRYREVSNVMVKSYDIPNLLKRKSKLIDFLKNKDKKNRTTTFILILFSSAFLLLMLALLRRTFVLKNRFEKIIHEMNKERISVTRNVSRGVKISNMSPDLINRILNDLEEFEVSKKFIQNKYTLSSLAKELGTNSAYLSKVVNLKKSTSFTNYLNNLRVDYAIKKITEDPIFRLYTIKAIAKESGFNYQQTFSVAFYKRTKLKPSYFIKKYNKC